MINMLPTAQTTALDRRVHFREQVLRLEGMMREMQERGEIDPNFEEKCPLTHYFTPKSEYGCYNYARQIFLPKGSVVIGKIHKHEHLNFIMQGKVSVNTEFGKKYFEAPCVFVSELGLKRAVYAEEDTIWVTVHMVKYGSEADLDKIEDEVIAKTYEEIGLISSTTNVQIGEI